MKERTSYCFPYLSEMGVQIIESGQLGTVVRAHPRPFYSMDEARTVCRWLQGREEPLQAMVIREYDSFDPVYVRGCVGYNSPRKGLAPLPDKE